MFKKENSNRFLPTTAAEVRQRGWSAVDIVFVTGDAYVDHPSFAMAILGRALEQAGFRVAILSQPVWKNCEPWREFGKPQLFFAISAGNMDSLINHYTANRKVRNDDAYSPGGLIGLRPDRATLSYCQRAREAYPGVPIIAGGVEASLRRLAHYDYWSDTVKRSILLDAKPDLIAYGMGEKPILEIARRLQAGETVKDLRNMRSVVYALGAKEQLPEAFEGKPVVMLPSYEEVKADKMQFSEATRIMHSHTNPFSAKALVQYHDKQAVVANPPSLPLSQEEMDEIYNLPFTRKPHPSYKDAIPAHEMIKNSVSVMRGCFGGCNFCSITAHQGKIVQSRSEQSVLNEIKNMAADPEFNGVVSDVGGPTANMYQMRCTRPDIEARCRRPSCVTPGICSLLDTNHQPIINVLKKARAIPGVRKVFVASGVRMDLAQKSPEYLRELAAYHVSGLLKVAPEHTHPDVLKRMRKPAIDNFGKFSEEFKKASADVGKPKQYLVPYFIASHPGSDLNAMIDLALYLKRNGYKPDQVQDFIPAPYDISTSMYHTGIDPYTRAPVPVAKGLRDRKMQRALMQFFKPENYFSVREALEQAGRLDLIGSHCDALIPLKPPAIAIQARRQRAGAEMLENANYTHTVANPAKKANTQTVRTPGYRPDRRGAKRQCSRSNGQAVP